MKDPTPDERQEKRLETAKPILGAFWRWLDSVKNSCLLKLKLEKAVDYAVDYAVDNKG